MVGARSDLPLTAQGCEQAKQFARRLVAEGMVPKAIYAGSLKRQIETANIISENLTATVQPHEAALTEIDYGAWEGLTQEEVMSRWPQEYSDWTGAGKWARGVFGRSREDHLTDIQHWIAHLRASHASGDQIVAVTSNGVLRFFYSLQETDWQRYVQEARVEHLKVKTGHFCELHLLEDSVQIKRWNVKP